MADAQVTTLLAQAREAMQRRDLVVASSLAQRALQIAAEDLAALVLLAEIAYLSDDVDRELAFLIRAVKVAPRHARLRSQLGSCYTLYGDYSKALAQFDKAQKLDPDAIEPRTGKTHLLQRTNKWAKARRLLEPLVRGGAPSPPIAHLYLRVLTHDGELEEAIAVGRAVLDAGHAEDFHLRATAFQLARAYERHGDIDLAFATATRANGMLRPAFDPDAFDAEIDALIATGSRARIAATSRPAEPSETPIFIVGVPRCGSTLVERIVASHPQTHGAGEIRTLPLLIRDLPMRIGSTLDYPACLEDLDQADVDTLAASYLDKVRALAPRALRVTDKYLGNGMHLGLIARLFPAARVIHCRRDPVDTCLSCYMEPFPPTTTFVSDLVHLGRYARAFDRIMTHWAGAVDVARLDLDYESLVADQEAETRRLVEFCGLPWHDACLRPHEARRHERTLSYDQARRPVYRSSVGRAERFGRHLDPLRAALGLGA